MGKDLRIKTPAYFGRGHLVSGRCRFIDEPFGNHLPAFPPAAAGHTVGNAGEVACGHTHRMGGVAAMGGWALFGVGAWLAPGSHLDLIGGFTPETEALLQAETQAIYGRIIADYFSAEL